MRTTRIAMAALAIALASGVAMADEEKTEASTGAYKMVCTKGSETRKIEVISEKGPDSNEPPCRVQYTKGETVNEKLYSSAAQAGFCEEKAKAFVERHTTEWGFKCEPIK